MPTAHLLSASVEKAPWLDSQYELGLFCKDLVRCFPVIVPVAQVKAFCLTLRRLRESVCLKSDVVPRPPCPSLLAQSAIGLPVLWPAGPPPGCCQPRELVAYLSPLKERKIGISQDLILEQCYNGKVENLEVLILWTILIVLYRSIF